LYLNEKGAFAARAISRYNGANRIAMRKRGWGMIRSRSNIVVLDGYALNPGDLSWDELRRIGKVDIHDRTPPELVVERARGAEIVLTNKTPLPAATLEMLPELRYVGVLATGYDVVDVDAAASRGVAVANVPSYGTASVAQYTIGLLLELCHRVGAHAESTRSGDWSRSPDWTYWRHPQTELEGKTLGLIGAGRIGVQVGRIASALGMNVLAYHYRREPGGRSEDGFEWASLEDLLRRADVVSLHCPLTADTRELIDRERLALMKPSAFLINTARGKLLNERDVADALNEGRLAGAALDVLSEEPPAPDHPLLSARHCLVTPHLAWASVEARRRLLDAAVANVRAFLSGRPTNLVNRPR